MNRIYSLVWNRTLHSVQVASELARPRGGSASRGPASRLHKHPLALACAAALALASIAFALPAAATPTCPAGSTVIASGVGLPGTRGAPGTVYGSAGSAGAAGAVVGANVSAACVPPASVEFGGAGGQGGYSIATHIPGSPGGYGGNGGNGGAGIHHEGAGSLVNLSGIVVGGDGGPGSYGGAGGANPSGEQGGRGGAGGNGGAGITGGSALTNSGATASVTGGQGGYGGQGGEGGAGLISTGGKGGVGGNGGVGGDGVITTQLINGGNSISGGSGGHGGSGGSGQGGDPDGGNGNDGGLGGLGGRGVVLSASTALSTNSVTINGGAGGMGGTGGSGQSGVNAVSIRAGNGGGGGNGVAGGSGNFGVAGSGFNLTNSGTITGGSGGMGGFGGAGGDGADGAPLVSMGGGNGGDGGHGGNGGAGADAVTGTNFTLTNTNSGTIQGGIGGFFGIAGAGGTGGIGGSANPFIPNSTPGANGDYGTDGFNGDNGAGAPGVYSGGGATVVNAGSISGGIGGAGFGARADAVLVRGGANTITLESGYSFAGNVVSASAGTNGGDTLALGGDTSPSGAFSLSHTVEALPGSPASGTTYYVGFDNYEKTGASTWTVTGADGTSAPWTVVAGTLKSDGATLGGDATVDSGATFTGNGTIDGNVTVNAGGTLSVPTSGQTLTLGTLSPYPGVPGLGLSGGGNVTNAGSIEVGAGASLASDGASLSNSGSITIGTGASLEFGALNALNQPVTSVSNLAAGTITLAGGTLVVEGLGGDTFSNAGRVSGFGTIGSAITNSGLVNANGGTLTITGGVQGNQGDIVVSPGAVLDLSRATTGSTVATLLDHGSIQLGNQNITVSTDYQNAYFGPGNSFNKRAGVTGSGQIDAAGNVAQAITGADVAGGTTATPTLAFGNVHVGSINATTYAIENAGTSGPALRGAIQTSVGGGNLTSGSLSGNGVIAQGYGPIPTGASASGYDVTYTPTTAGALSGQALHVANNFGNVAEQTMTITGVAYAYADPTVASSLTPAYNFGVVQVGQAVSDPLTVINTLTASSAAYQEGLNASFGTISDAQLSGVGSITNLGAGQSNASGMVVALTPAAAGAISGTVTLHFASNGAGTSGLGVTNLPAQSLGYSWQFTGQAVDQASPSVTPNPVSFGNVRIGSTQSQALAVANVATGSPQASLNAQVTATTGAASSNNLSSISELASGVTDNNSFVVGMNTATAGAQTGSVAIALQSDSAPNGCTSNCIVTLPTDAVNVSGNVYRLADPALNTTSVSLAARVGDATPMAGISVTNTSPDQYTEGLAAGFGGSTPTGFTNNGGSVGNLVAGDTDLSSLQVGLNTSKAGSVSGNQAVAFTSDGQIDHATPESVGSQNVALIGNVYTPAQATVTTAGPVNFGIVHVGDGGGTLAQAIGVTNSAPMTALNDTLLGNVSVSGDSAFSGDGSLGMAGLAAGKSSTGMSVNLDTATAGNFTGSASLAFASHDSQLADLDLAGSSLGLGAQVNNYAALSFSFGSGLGSLTFDAGTDTYTLDLGNVLLNSNSGVTNTLLSFLNSGGPAAYTDLLSSQGSVASGSGFSLANDAVSDLAGDATQSGFGIGLSTLTAGAFNELMAFNVNSSNASGYSHGIGTVNFVIEGNVVTAAVNPVPEPGDLGMLGLGLAALGGLVVFDRRRRSPSAGGAHDE